MPKQCKRPHISLGLCCDKIKFMNRTRSQSRLSGKGNAFTFEYITGRWSFRVAKRVHLH